MSAASTTAIQDAVAARALAYTDAVYTTPLSARYGDRVSYRNRTRAAQPFPYMTLELTLRASGVVDGAVAMEGEGVLTLYARPTTPAQAAQVDRDRDQVTAAFRDFVTITSGMLRVQVASASPLPSGAGTLGGAEVDAQVDGTRFVLAVRAIGFGPLVTAAA